MSYYVTEPTTLSDIDRAAKRAAERGGRQAVHLHHEDEPCVEGCYFVEAPDRRAHQRDLAGRPLSGWCTACGMYLHRPRAAGPLHEADGKHHAHRDPWDLGDRPEVEQ